MENENSLKLKKESREKGQEEERFSEEEDILITKIREDHNKHLSWLSSSILGILNKSTGRSFKTDIFLYYLYQCPNLNLFIVQSNTHILSKRR